MHTSSIPLPNGSYHIYIAATNKRGYLVLLEVNGHFVLEVVDLETPHSAVQYEAGHAGELSLRCLQVAASPLVDGIVQVDDTDKAVSLDVGVDAIKERIRERNSSSAISVFLQGNFRDVIVEIQASEVCSEQRSDGLPSEASGGDSRVDHQSIGVKDADDGAACLYGVGVGQRSHGNLKPEEETVSD